MYSSTTGTPYARNRRPRSHFDRVALMHSEGMTKAAIARVMRVAPSTVTRWITKAAAHARLFHGRHTRVEEAVELQLDELSCRGCGRARGHWVFSGIEVGTRLWLGLRVARRTERSTRIHVREVCSTLARLGEWTVFTTDGFKYYAKTLRRVMTDRPAVHIEVENKYSRGRVVRSRRRRRMGSEVAHADAMERNYDSRKPNTAFVERFQPHEADVLRAPEAANACACAQSGARAGGSRARAGDRSRRATALVPANATRRGDSGDGSGDHGSALADPRDLQLGGAGWRGRPSRAESPIRLLDMIVTPEQPALAANTQRKSAN